MKHFQKILLMMMCVLMLANLTGCGNNDASHNGAANSATEGTENKEDADHGGVAEDIGDDVQDGIDHVEDAVDGNDDSKNDSKDDSSAGTDNADQSENDSTGNDVNR